MSNLTTPKKYLKQDDGMAIPMINYDLSQGKFIINKDAISIIESMDKPLGIISVAGMYRTGKSYLLNRMLLNRSGGFSVGPSINPCTKGLWMWNKPISCYTPDSQPINVLIIDTEGIGATDEDQNHDNKIMTLAILLSSYFIFNSLGTIDENAIQNLSFIVNITKNIQSKNKSTQFNLYLPSFMWVIRDFSLQLKNSEGHPITSKEYLEKSLELQKGNTEFITSKNQIRALVKEYFKERDCITLVRPLTEEDNLQNLEKVESNKLRHEFIEQINRLRKTVINSIKPKTMNGQMLNGEMLVNLIQSYVEMINKGAVPIIQSAWSYMVQSECAKAKENSKDIYNKKMIDLEKKFPMDEDELKSYHKDIKRQAIDSYVSASIGDVDQAKVAEMKKDFKVKYNEFKEKNASSLQSKMQQFLQESFNEIDTNVSQGNYKTVTDYKADIDDFVTYANESSPNGPGRSCLILQFIIENMMKHSHILSNNSINEMEQLVANNKDSLNTMNQSITNTKAEYERLQKDLDDKLAKLSKYQSEKENMIALAKKDTDNYSKLIEEKTNQVKKLNEKLSVLDKENTEKINEMKKNVNVAEKNQRDKELKYTEVSSEFEKEKVLLEQKLIFLEKTLKELTESKLTEIKSFKKESTTTNANIKEQLQKYETQVKDLNKKISSMQEKALDLDTKLHQKEKRIENEKAKIEEMLNEYDRRLSELKLSNEIAEEEKESCLKQRKDNESLIKSEYEAQIEDLLKENYLIESEYKSSEESQRQQLLKATNELSLLKLDNENSEKKLLDIKNQLSNDKMEYDKYIKILEENNKKLLEQYEDRVKENNDLKASQSDHLTQITTEQSIKQSMLQSENDKLQSELNALISEYTKTINELTMKLSSNEKTILPDYQNRISSLEAKVEKFRQQTLDILSANKSAIDEINFEHTSEIHEILMQCREEIEDNNNKNEKEILEIRKCLEIEKGEIEGIIRENAEISKERLNQIEEENEQQLKTIEKEKDDKIDELADNLQECEQIHNNYVMETDQEMALKMQQIESLNKFLSDAKNSLSTIQRQHEESLQTQNERFINEKEELNIRINELSEENKQNDSEMNVLNCKNKEIEVSLGEITTKYDETKETFEREKKETEAKITQLNQDLSRLNSEFLSNKSSYGKEISLKQQEIEFLNEKLAEYKRQLEEFQATFEEKIQQCKEQIIAEYTSKIQLVQKEKESLEKTLEDVKSKHKALEEKYQIETAQLKKEKEFLIEKLTTQTKKKKDLTECLEKEREESQVKLVKIKEDFLAKNLQLTKENEVIQSKLKKIEGEYTELSAIYEKDNHVWTSKFHYLEEQRDLTKKEHNELRIKYEAHLDDIQNKIIAERERLEKIYRSDIAKRTDAYSQQLETADKLFQEKFEEVNSQNKNLSSENKILIDKIAKYEDNDTLRRIEANLAKAIESERRVRAEYDEMSMNKGGKVEGLKAKLLNEREDHQKKISAFAKKLSDYDEKRSNLAVDIVKQTALSEKDKEMKVNTIQKLNEKIKELERINMKLVTENKETLRENEQMRKSSRNSSANHSNGGYVPKYKITSNNKENLRTQGNIQVDKLDFLPTNKKSKYMKDSQRSDEENINQNFNTDAI